jgi:hypothetical protein
MSDKLKVLGCLAEEIELTGRYQVFRGDAPISGTYDTWLDARDFVIMRKFGHEEVGPSGVKWLVRDDPAVNIRCGVEIVGSQGIEDLL